MENQIEIAKGPRPDLYRKNWVDLNGSWKFEFDDKDRGLREEWYLKHEFTEKIQVPFCYQSERSGIYQKEGHEILWYQRELAVTEEMAQNHVWLHFGAVDYEAEVWINGTFVCCHQGGSTPFSVKISDQLRDCAEFTITLRCVDSYDCAQPRGKQHWNVRTDRCWYTATSGIWQNVWLEIIPGERMERVLLTPDIDEKTVLVQIDLRKNLPNMKVEWDLRYKDKPIKQGTYCCQQKRISFVIGVEEEDPIDNLIHLWSPDTPNVYDLDIRMYSDGVLQDEIQTYFGMRSIQCQKGNIVLNHVPLYQKLVLHQGYYKESLMTPPSDEALIQDIQAAKDMGFNGIRMHQKMEDPRFYYYADRMGMLVWGELPSNYEFTREGQKALLDDYYEMIMRDYNHPSIITWVPFNESWGVRDILHNKMQQNFAESFYSFAKSIDITRLVSTNDGWETVKSDFVGIHDYEGDGGVFYEKYKDKEKILSDTAVGKMIYSECCQYHGEPVFISEFGGIAFEDGNEDSWGYNGKVKGVGEFAERFSGLMKAVKSLPYLSGYCYTQLTDVEQETNGLMTADRKWKLPVEEINRILNQRFS